MKKTLIKIFFAVSSLLCLISCQKSPADRISGSYSFKNGGVLEILGEIPATGLLQQARDTVIKSSLIPESGQMRVLPKGGDEMVVTMNIAGGSPVVFTGKLDGEKLILSSVERKISMFNELSDMDLPIDALVSVEGEGSLYGNTLVFSMKYSGSFEYGNIFCRILSSDVNCLATRNE